jgi:hypothetical protein
VKNEKERRRKKGAFQKYSKMNVKRIFIFQIMRKEEKHSHTVLLERVSLMKKNISALSGSTEEVA